MEASTPPFHLPHTQHHAEGAGNALVSNDRFRISVHESDKRLYIYIYIYIKREREIYIYIYIYIYMHMFSFVFY